MESVPVPAGEGDLAVAAKFALESIEVADSAAGLERRQRKKGDRSDSSDAGSSSDDDSSDDDSTSGAPLCRFRAARALPSAIRCACSRLSACSCIESIVATVLASTMTLGRRSHSGNREGRAVAPPKLSESKGIWKRTEAT